MDAALRTATRTPPNWYSTMAAASRLARDGDDWRANRRAGPFGAVPHRPARCAAAAAVDAASSRRDRRPRPAAARARARPQPEPAHAGPAQLGRWPSRAATTTASPRTPRCASPSPRAAARTSPSASRRSTLGGSGSATVKRYAHRLDLAALGLAAGDDLIVQLSVDDNRTPTPQSARSASLILRWPSDLGTETTGLEGMVKKVLPAYFRSQRQIIIDAEALLKEKRKLDAERYVEAQRRDRRRPAHPAPALRPVPRRGVRRRAEAAADQRCRTRTMHDARRGDKRQPTTRTHTSHGRGRSRHSARRARCSRNTATPTTTPRRRRCSIRKRARRSRPHSTRCGSRKCTCARAIPNARCHTPTGRCASSSKCSRPRRIYLARVGPELPPIDESRRLGGDRAGLARRDDALIAASAADPTLAALWHSLDESATDRPAVDFVALERWLRAHEARLADPLAFVAAIEALRADPQCAPCRSDLRALLWPLLPRPAATVPRRDAGDAGGRRYLEALRQEEAQ